MEADKNWFANPPFRRNWITAEGTNFDDALTPILQATIVGQHILLITFNARMQMLELMYILLVGGVSQVSHSMWISPLTIHCMNDNQLRTFVQHIRDRQHVKLAGYQDRLIYRINHIE